MRALRCGTHGGCKAARTAAHNENVGRNLFNALGSSCLGCPLIKVRNLAARGNDGGCNTFENPLAGHRGAAYRINVDAVGLNNGGGNALNLAEYLACDKIFAVGGSWMVDGKLVADGRFDEIERLSREAVAIANTVRS